MSRIEPSNINHCIAPSINSPITNLAKDSIQHNDEIKTEFTSREGTYKISSLIDNLGKIGPSTCLNEPVRITLLPHIQTFSSQNSSRRSSSSAATSHHDNNLIEQKTLSNGNSVLTDILAFNVGRELIVYEFSETSQVIWLNNSK